MPAVEPGGELATSSAGRLTSQPVEQEPALSEVVRDAIATYTSALAAMEQNPRDRLFAQLYYKSAAELALVSTELDLVPEELVEVFGNIRQDRGLFHMVSSSARSWMGWAGRQTAGIAVAGTLERFEERIDGTVAFVRTSDKRSSVVPALVVAGELPEVGQQVLLVGRILDADVSVGVQIRGQIAPRQPSQN